MKFTRRIKAIFLNSKIASGTMDTSPVRYFTLKTLFLSLTLPLVAEITVFDCVMLVDGRFLFLSSPFLSIRTEQNSLPLIVFIF